MVFYKIEAVQKSEEEKELSRQERKDLSAEISERSEYLFHKSGRQRLVFTVSMKAPRAVFGAIIKNNESIEKAFSEYEKIFPLSLELCRAEEITFAALTNLLVGASRNNYISDDDDVLRAFEIDDLNSRYMNPEFGEGMLPADMNAESAEGIAEEYLFTSTLTPEIRRIFTDIGRKKPQGHPVQYILQTNDHDTRFTIYRTILSSLVAAGRILNRRYCYVDFDEESMFPDQSFDTLYKSSENGSVVIRYHGGSDSEGEFSGRDADIIAAICETAKKYKNKVLTIICIPENNHKIKEEFLLNWDFTSFVELKADVVFGERAENYLRNKAREYKIRVDKKLLPLHERDNGYTMADLNRIFEEWHDQKLRNVIYPQYKETKTAKLEIRKEEPKGSAYEKLQSMIGLAEAKKVMNQALNFYKAQKLFSDRGMKIDRPSMHMVFTGNPGTAKTTVARLFARVMKENGLLDNGDLHEVGRADLVGKYVGHTAPLVKQAFNRAKGGVLFIDEAYSLVDDRDGMYGDEAINTIVQEMENHREDVVVIFAGYPDKMEGFLGKNPGLRSRIAFHVPFEDYDADELCGIAELIAKDKGLILAEDAVSKLNAVFESARSSSDFGNGRFARNVIEKAKMAQANRLVTMQPEDITDCDIVTIHAEDIEAPIPHQEKNIKIGFVA